MLWNASNEDIDFQGLRQNTRLMVFAEDAATVFDTLLVRPEDKQTLWAGQADMLDLSRIGLLTLVGQLDETCLPAQSRTGHWGFRAQSLNDGGKGLKRFIYQLNANPAIIDHFANVGTGTLLWVSDRSDLIHASDPDLRLMWAAAPVANFLPLTPTANYTLGDPLAVTFEDRTVLNAAPDGISDTVILTDQLATDLTTAMQSVVMSYPYVAPAI